MPQGIGLLLLKGKKLDYGGRKVRKNLFKKITAAVLSLTLVVGMTSAVSAAHAANGANVASSGKWSSFSVCTREDGGVWEDALKEVEVLNEAGEFERYQTYLQDYATEGYVSGLSTINNCEFYIKNTGWDGEYDPNGNLVGDNPWGLWAAVTDIPIERGRYYTISFQIKSTLKGKTTLKDENGNPILDANGEEQEVDQTIKHISFKGYDPISPGEPGVDFIDVTGASISGMITLDSASDEWQTVTALVKIPETKKLYAADYLGFKFACGSRLVSYPDEIAMSGYIYIKDFKVTAGTQHKVTFTNGSKSSSVYVNDGAKVSSVALGKKGYTLTGYKTASGATYNFSSPVKSDMTLTAVYKKTAKPAKPKVTLKSKKKKAAVSWKKVKNANGYEVKYSQKKNMKGAKKKTTTKAKYTIKKLKSKKYVYVQVRAYTKDSLGNKVYGKFSKKKKVYVK